MKTPTENLIDEVKNWSLDDWKVLRDDPKLLSSVLSSVQKAAPEVFENVLRTAMLANDPNAEDNDWRTDQMKALSGEDWEEDHFGEEQAADLKKELGTGGASVNKPDTKDTGMSEQERELREAILGGMQDGPGGD